MPTTQQRVQQHGRPPVSLAEWAAAPGRVVTRGELIAVLKLERATMRLWLREQRWHRRVLRWLRTGLRGRA